MLFSSRKRFVDGFASLIMVAVILAALADGVSRERPERWVVLRVDDVQDFAFSDAQLFLLNYSIEADLDLSLGIIAGMFGDDAEILEATRLAVRSGCEVGIHGWKHEDLANLSLKEQTDVLSQAKSLLRQKLGVNARLLIPPMFSFNDDTLSAMKEVSCSFISTCADFDQPRLESEIKMVPATVELSTLQDGEWQMKSAEAVMAEVERSFKLYGYAAIVTHPQEFYANGEIDQSTVDHYVDLVGDLRETCNFTNFEKIAGA